MMRWCSSGMHDAPEAGGEWIEGKGTRRWQCATCCANKKPPNREPYAYTVRSAESIERHAVAVEAYERRGPKGRR